MLPLPHTTQLPLSPSGPAPRNNQSVAGPRYFAWAVISPRHSHTRPPLSLWLRCIRLSTAGTPRQQAFPARGKPEAVGHAQRSDNNSSRREDAPCRARKPLTALAPATPNPHSVPNPYHHHHRRRHDAAVTGSRDSQWRWCTAPEPANSSVRGGRGSAG